MKRNGGTFRKNGFKQGTLGIARKWNEFHAPNRKQGKILTPKSCGAKKKGKI